MTDLLIYVILPLVISNVLHMVFVKNNLFSGLAVPVSEGLFGRNKTWRGFVIVPLLNAFMLLIICFFYPYFSLIKAFTIGFLLGFAYVLFELPNSHLKRRLGIAPGGKAESQGWVFMIVDKTDSGLGISLCSYFLFDLTTWQTSQLFLVSVLTHVFFSLLLTAAGIKKNY